MLAWWISASRALRDPLRDNGLPPWNMTPQGRRSRLLFVSPPPPITSSQAYKTHRGLGKARRGSRSNERVSKQEEGQQEKKWKTQAVLVWVCGKVALGREGRETVKGGFCPSCAHGPLGFTFINEGAGDVSASCGVVCLRRSARALE